MSPQKGQGSTPLYIDSDKDSDEDSKEDSNKDDRKDDCKEARNNSHKDCKDDRQEAREEACEEVHENSKEAREDSKEDSNDSNKDSNDSNKDSNDSNDSNEDSDEDRDAKAEAKGSEQTMAKTGQKWKEKEPSEVARSSVLLSLTAGVSTAAGDVLGCTSAVAESSSAAVEAINMEMSEMGQEGTKSGVVRSPAPLSFAASTSAADRQAQMDIKKGPSNSP
ncbi:hypothetical protein EWM64_g3788 [Hericium alpestre]|uniref:Uncharacterized protein n=1 Tax=Hericium alpestre TaxID=135208 RepID=A0A4Z0A170_9AGAM|nr:hypothetical protein EWM64_g3788 [Hericium alpestre]